jgi:alpha-N-arabinofuranosidase
MTDILRAIAGAGLAIVALTACAISPAAEFNGGTTPFGVGIKLDAAKIVREIPRSLYGANVEWFRSANGLWDESSNRFDPRLLAAAGELSLSLIRFPGGALADYYHWRDGVGSAAGRPVRPHVLDDGRSRNSFGTDELLRFCRRIGADPLISVNVATGSPEEAADWVAYCNRPNSGNSVRYWEIGNEPYMKREGRTAASGMSAAQYATKVLAFSGKMRQASPGIRLVAVGGLNFGRVRFVADPDWDKMLLERAGGAIDYLAVHNSYAPVLINDESISVEDAYRALFAFPAEVRRNLEALCAQIDRYAPRESGRIRLAITEWGPLFQILPSSRWVDHDKTLGSGLFAASVMQVFLNSPRLDIANFFKLTESGFMGWVNADGTPKPSYLALSLYTRHFGTRLTATVVDGPTFDAAPAGVVSAARNVPFVDAVSSLSGDGKRLYLIAVNKHFTAPAMADVHIAGFKPSQSGRRWVLTGSGVDANNGPDLPDAPGLKWAAQAQAERDPQFYNGARDRIRIAESKVEHAGSHMKLVLPPLSATAIQFDLSIEKADHD